MSYTAEHIWESSGPGDSDQGGVGRCGFIVIATPPNLHNQAAIVRVNWSYCHSLVSHTILKAHPSTLD